MSTLSSKNLEYIHYLLSFCTDGRMKFGEFCKIKVCLSYSACDQLTANYIKLALNLSSIEVKLIRRVRKKRNMIYPYDFYISILPLNYGRILSEDYEFKKELRCLIKNQKSKIILICTDPSQNPAMRTLLNSLNEVSTHPVQSVYLNDLFQSLSIPVKQIARTIMTQQSKTVFKASDSVTDIMTRKESLLTVNKDSSISDAYLLMEQSGKRHCPVIDARGKFVRMISRTDMYEKIPPMPDKIPKKVYDDANLNLDSNAAYEALMNLVSQTVGQVFQNPPGAQNVISLRDTSTISEVIEAFSKKYDVLSSKGLKKVSYFTALPVLNSNGEIEGVVSFIDIFRKFFKNQAKFLNTPLFHLATMAEYYEKPTQDPDKLSIDVNKVRLTTLKDKNTLSNVVMLMQMRGFRSLPIVDEISNGGDPNNIKREKLIGFVSDVQVKMYSHEDFFSSLFPLPVTYFMTKVDFLHKPKPDDLLYDILEKFWIPPSDNQPLPSSFAICDPDDILLGLISYVDILKYWLRYQKE
jgi:CBS domain-containing protein